METNHGTQAAGSGLSRRSFLMGSVAAAFAAVSAGTLTACGSGGSSSSDGSGSPDDRVLQVRFDLAAAPMSYIDDDGNATGLDVELLRLVDERLDGYTFNIEGTSKDDVISGMTTGTYDIGLHNAFYTEDRAKKFFIPKENLGGSLAGLAFRTADAAQFDGLVGDDLLEAVHDAGFKFAPMISGDGRTFQIEQYNEKHPDKAFDLEYTDDMDIEVQYYDWILNGRYDTAMFVKGAWDKRVNAEDGAYHSYADQLKLVNLKAIKTYPMISRINLDQEFTDKLSEALHEVKQTQECKDLTIKFYGENIWETYPFEEGW